MSLTLPQDYHCVQSKGWFLKEGLIRETSKFTKLKSQISEVAEKVETLKYAVIGPGYYIKTPAMAKKHGLFATAKSQLPNKLKEFANTRGGIFMVTPYTVLINDVFIISCVLQQKDVHLLLPKGKNLLSYVWKKDKPEASALAIELVTLQILGYEKNSKQSTEEVIVYTGKTAFQKQDFNYEEMIEKRKLHLESFTNLSVYLTGGCAD